MTCWPALTGARWRRPGHRTPASVYFTADDQGRRPVFRGRPATGEVTRLTADDGAYDTCARRPTAGRSTRCASAIDEPPTPVRLDLTAAGSEPQPAGQPGLAAGAARAGCEEIETTADDGARIRAWLVLPDGASGPSPRRCCCGCTAAR